MMPASEREIRLLLVVIALAWMAAWPHPLPIRPKRRARS